jgi:hypothetical protein
MDGKRRGKNMMSRVQLEVFHLASQTPASDIVVLGKLELEETRLSAFDKGYAAGWEDAAEAVTTEKTRLEAEVGRNVQSLGFTFEEVRTHVLHGLRPFLSALLERLLPPIAKETLAQFILDTLSPYAEAAVDHPVRIFIHPRARLYIEQMMKSAARLPFKIVEDSDLGEGQVYLRFESGEETMIDLDRAIAQIMTAVQNFFDQTDQERRYG